MKLKIKPITQQFKLNYDVEGDSTVTIRQVKTGDLVTLGDLFSEQTQIFDDIDLGTVQLKRKWNAEELKRERAYCTLVGIDLKDEDTDEDIFKFKTTRNGPELAMSHADFIAAWNSLPAELTTEIYGYIVEVNPIFDPSASGE